MELLESSEIGVHFVAAYGFSRNSLSMKVLESRWPQAYCSRSCKDFRSSTYPGSYSKKFRSFNVLKVPLLVFACFRSTTSRCLNVCFKTHF